MSDHLRFSGLSASAQRAELETIVLAEPVLVTVLEGLRDLSLPDGWLVSGAIYNSVWNALTGQPSMTGVKDADLFYFDAEDLSYEAEDAVIKRAEPIFAGLPVPVEIRNQARVHLWYEGHFGQPYPPLHSSREAIDRFACTTHAVGMRLGDGGLLETYAPYGLDEIFSFRLVPNRMLDNRKTHEAKAARQMQIWPELTMVPW
ncbi:MAG TPA: nucleotidyltransferase family protein [Devosiaceae bacterium]|jgi:hypothetical protein